MSLVDHLTQATYLAAAALFIFSLRWLSTPKTARQGVAAGVAGMTLAVIGTVLHPEIVSYKWILIALVVGTAIGVPLSWVPLTAVPQRTALSHAFGGLAAGLVGTAKYMLWLQDGELTSFRTFAIVVEVLLGFLTFTGSLWRPGSSRKCCRRGRSPTETRTSSISCCWPSRSPLDCIWSPGLTPGSCSPSS